MTRATRILKGVAALAILTGLVAAVPWALVRYIGWPLPHALPSWAQFTTALHHQGIPDRTLIDALSIVVWLAWLTLTASLALELPAAIKGHTAQRVAWLGPVQPATGRLVAVILVGLVATLPRPAPAARPTPLIASLGYAGPPPAVAMASAVIPEHAPGASELGAARATPARSYVVDKGDTLWGIAETELGDPLRWQEIYDLNDGRVQPDGRTLTDPHWIYPGWVLQIPAPAAAAQVPPANPPSHPAESPTRMQPSNHAPRPEPTSTATTGAHSQSSTSLWVELASGSRFAATFAAGILAAVATGRLRRRRSYRPSEPNPVLVLPSSPPDSGLTRLLAALRRNADNDDTPLPGQVAAMATVPLTTTPTPAARQHPDVIEVGTRDDQPIRLALGDWSPLAIGGATATDVLRAWLGAMLTACGPYGVDILTTHELAERLIPNPVFPSIRRCGNDEQVLRAFETEVIGRTRRFAEVEADDADAYRSRNPEDPLGLLLTITPPWPTDLASRWRDASNRGQRLGCLTLCIAESNAAGPAPESSSHGYIELDHTGLVTDASPPDLATRLCGARLYQLMSADVKDLLAPVSEVHDERLPGTDDHEPAGGADKSPNGLRTNTPAASPTVGKAWTEPSRTPEAHPPISVRVFGPAQVDAWGQTIKSGLRASAYELLTWYLVRPEGATSEAAIESIWPNETPEKGRDRFWTALGNLRSRLRGPDGQAVSVLIKSGDHYRADPDVLDVDLWQFQAALGRAARASELVTELQALTEAITVYRGDICPGADYLWIEPVREDFHRRALDAHIRAAEVHVQQAKLEAAIATLEHAIEVDGLCEEAYRRLIRLQLELGRRDSAQRTLNLLRGRLAELDLEPDPDTCALLMQTGRIPAKQLTPRGP